MTCLKAITPFLLLLLCLLGCGDAATTSPTEEPTSTVVPTATALPTSTPLPTSTLGPEPELLAFDATVQWDDSQEVHRVSVSWEVAHVESIELFVRTSHWDSEAYIVADSTGTHEFVLDNYRYAQTRVGLRTIPTLDERAQLGTLSESALFTRCTYRAFNSWEAAEPWQCPNSIATEKSIEDEIEATGRAMVWSWDSAEFELTAQTIDVPCRFEHFFEWGDVQPWLCPVAKSAETERAVYIPFENGFILWSRQQNPGNDIVTFYIVDPQATRFDADEQSRGRVHFVLAPITGEGHAAIESIDQLLTNPALFLDVEDYTLPNLGARLDDGIVYTQRSQTTFGGVGILDHSYFTLPDGSIIERCNHDRSNRCHQWHYLRRGE